MRSILLLISFCVAGTAAAQLSNSTFRRGPDMPSTKWGASMEALQYLKNNEYYNNINPGATLFGFQAKGLFHYRISPNATFSAGALLQRDFGDLKGLSRGIPTFNFNIRRGFWQWNLGNISPHIHHNLAEPLMDYENIMKNPVEGGLQAVRHSKTAFYDVWLEWKQKADENKGIQERIVFGNSLEKRLLSTSTISLSLPVQAIIFHEGGQALNIASHIKTLISGAAGLRAANRDTTWLAESLLFGSMDNSPASSQPFGDGWAFMGNLRVKPHRYHEIALSYWFSREFVSHTGNAMYSNVNLKDVYLNRNTRNLAMLRYVFSRPIIGDKIWVDFRLEPYYDFEYGTVEMSQGLFFRYTETLNVRLPRWMGL